MYINNLLRPGSYCLFEPLGLHIEITYNVQGAIASVARYIGENDTNNMEGKFFDTVLKSNIVPRRILLTGSTTKVSGVLYTDTPINSIGKLPECAGIELAEYFIKHPARFKFLASTVESGAASFPSQMHVKQWLTLNHFNTSPGLLIPSDLDDNKLRSLLLSVPGHNITTIYGSVISYIGSSYTRKFVNLIQDKIEKIEQNVANDGTIYADIYLTYLQQVHTTHYSLLYKYNLSKNKLIIFDQSNIDEIIYSSYNDLRVHKPVEDTIVCPTCKKLIKMGYHSIVKCDDEKCSSLQYVRISHFLKTLNLKKLDINDYKRLSKLNTHISLIDILDNKELKIDNITAPLATLLHAIIPINVLPKLQHAKELCDQCNNSLPTLLYYLSNPDKAYNDLSLDKRIYHNLFTWINTDNRIKEVEDIINHNKITIQEESSIKENAPIFRNKTIYITGTFKHGSYTTIQNILESYSAKVEISEFNENCDCVLIGDILEQVNGIAVKSALKHKIPVLSETGFFNKYEIDNDIK